MRKLVTAVAVGAIGVGVFVPAAAAEPNAQSGPGRRAVATMFFGDAPTAVRDAQRALQEACASQ
jgi:hypothetical protein